MDLSAETVPQDYLYENDRWSGKADKRRDIHVWILWKGFVKGTLKRGCLIEAPGVYPNMTAKENIEMKCRLFGISKKGYAEGILDKVGLLNVGKKKTKNFSLGMKQRLGIGMALVGEPDLLVLDEPINGLDPQGIAEVRDTIQNLCAQQDMTVFISSHIWRSFQSLPQITAL